MSLPLTQDTFPGMGVSLQEKVDRAIALLREHEHEALKLSPFGYHLGFSGGKDSCVILDLAKRSGVKFRPVYNQTTIDPPELVRFIKEYHPEVEWNRPRRNFFKALAVNGLPTRLCRWCCEEFKESGGDGTIKLLGVRADESIQRKKRWGEVTAWRSNLGGFVVAPIVFWSDGDVWEFIRVNSLPYCSLYNEGFDRIGCVGCPMARGQRAGHFRRWPGFHRAWLVAATKYWERTHEKIHKDGTPYSCAKYITAQDFFDWWMSDNPSPKETEQECLGLYDE